MAIGLLKDHSDGVCKRHPTVFVVTKEHHLISLFLRQKENENNRPQHPCDLGIWAHAGLMKYI